MEAVAGAGKKRARAGGTEGAEVPEGGGTAERAGSERNGRFRKGGASRFRRGGGYFLKASKICSEWAFMTASSSAEGKKRLEPVCSATASSDMGAGSRRRNPAENLV